MPYAAISNKKTSGNSIDGQGGWTIQEVAEVKAKLGISNSSSVDVKLGDSGITELTEADLRVSRLLKDIHPDTQINLRQGKSHLILKTVYTNSLKLFFKKVSQGGSEISVDIPLQDQQKLGGKYTVNQDGGVEVSGPIMVGYVPVNQGGIETLFPK